MYDFALNLYRKGHYKKVIELISLNNEINLLEIRGLSALKSQDFYSACETYEVLNKLSPSSLNSYHLGLSYLNNKRYGEAIQEFTKSSMELKFTINSNLSKAYCWIEMKEYTSALDVLSKVLNEDASLDQAWYLLLRIHRETENAKAYKLALLDSKNIIGNKPEWLYGYLYYLYLIKDFIEVINFTKHNMGKLEIRSKKVVAKSFLELSEFDKAIDTYKEILSVDTNAENYYNLASAYSKLTSTSDLKDALNNADKSLAININNHQSYFCKSLVYKKLNQIDKAEKEINQAVKLSNENTEYLNLKAEILYIKKRYKESKKEIEQILNLDSKNQLAYRLKGIVNLHTHKIKKSEKNLKKAIKIDATDQRAIGYYLITQLAQNNKQQIKKYMSYGDVVKSISLDPTKEYSSLKEFNNSLSLDIKNHSQLRNEPIGLAARNGYLTDDLFVDSTKSINLFKKLLLKTLNNYIESLPNDRKHYMYKHKSYDYSINSWATWVKGDGYIDSHIHEDSWFSGVYYCKIPKISKISKTNQGYFEYGCVPENLKLNIKPKRKLILPKEGMLLIFPSYLFHQTIPHDTQEDRISIAFDLTPKSWKK